ncbi:hypothetical protein [Pararhizobium sp.]|uniref:hypothetical protein n=1 Tax=Pararhizobium sp. TaxID=1977563 RepID=UPI002726F755|nr:hypothetical protein [Pararhizobium sp.]MDO9415635.1 hypothetical protein [Pararhizobium sp.]
MTMTRKFRVCAGIAGLLASSVTLSACVGPTYGTDKTAGEQLVDDLGSVASIGSNQTGPKVKYQPRAGLVLPADEQALVQPQQSLASKDNPNWVESPEDTRSRLREEATEKAASTTYRSPLASQRADGIDNTEMGQKKQTEKYREARRLQQGLYSDRRRSLTDPPLEYRKMPEELQADLGEPEKVKERRRKKEAEIANTGKKWWQF